MYSPLTDRPDARILDPERAKRQISLGWAAADLHVHTLHSHDVIPTRMVDPLTLFHKARRLGMTYVAFTDHDSMNAYDQIGWTREGLVPAVEVRILDRKKVGHTLHINVYTLNRGQFSEILRIAQIAQDLEQLISYLKGEHLPYTFNHPFWHEAGETPNLQAILDIVDFFPVLEYNMGRIARLNELALRLARARGRGIVATTDTHVGEIGRAFTIGRGGTFLEFFDQVRSGQTFIVPADLDISRLKGEASVRIRQLFNKSAWLHPKDSLSIDSGIGLLDSLVARMAQARSGTPGFANKILELLLKGASQSGIPGSLYLRSQRNLANQISGFLQDTEIAA
jgi:predicted metal-dependent phosphoesterase TrpH